ncbi:hypothetical protein A3B55_02555 [Candidatus Daviesbacteria bacterium RIFCSPLOWO2_01_FULL_43_15]|nr:MAG: hypothetical protein A3B55_02555 [Candidatus Daviesbacteria bacterium RIFCSPLOWO2_01_FULL_43_15]
MAVKGSEDPSESNYFPLGEILEDLAKCQQLAFQGKDLHFEGVGADGTTFRVELEGDYSLKVDGPNRELSLHFSGGKVEFAGKLEAPPAQATTPGPNANTCAWDHSLKNLLNRQIFKRGPWTIEDAQNYLLDEHDHEVPWGVIQQTLDELVSNGELVKTPIDGGFEYGSRQPAANNVDRSQQGASQDG